MTTPELVVVVATGQTTVVDVRTTVVTPPTVFVPAGTVVELAPQTVVVEVTVRVIAGMV